MSKNNTWGTLLKSYYSNKVANKHKKETNTDYSEVLDAMYGKLGDKKTEELVEEVPSHIVIDEQVEKYVEKHIVGEPEQLIETEVDAYEAAIAAGGQQIELQETQETHLVDGQTPRPVEKPDFTAEELEEFMRLNKIEKLHEIVEPTPAELESNEVIVTEKPTETKVKKVKVSKPTAPKKAGRPKAKK